MNWEEQKRIETIISNNIKEVPWEGAEVNISGLKDAIYEYGKLMYNQAVDDAVDKAETYEYPYLDACSECGHTATYVDRQSILKLKK